jgi:hypothetical protein
MNAKVPAEVSDVAIEIRPFGANFPLLSRTIRILTVASLVSVLGCAHRRGNPTLSLTGRASEANANLIAQAEVQTREKWKNVDSATRPLDPGWQVIVYPTPNRVEGPYVVVIVDPTGKVIDYRRRD